MAKGPKYSLKYKRRKQEKTDYAQRLALIKSGKPRLVVRKTNKRIIAQIVGFKQGGDVNVVSVSSTMLSKHGYKKLSFKNLPAAYLTGYLMGRKAVVKKTKSAVLDAGLNISTKGSKVYAVLKGAIDAGMKIPHKENVLPSNERIMGEHIKKTDFKKIVEDVKKKIDAKVGKK